MSIQYAGGTIINTTLTQSTGTRAELAQWIRDELILAGWTSSGSATDYQLTSATTAQSLACRVRVYDPGSGSCARLKMSNTGASKTQVGDLFLLPETSKVWRIIANKFQWFVFTPGSSITREFAAGGVPFLPVFLSGVITEGIWGSGSGFTDTDSTSSVNFRNALQTNTGNLPPNQYGLINSTAFDLSGGGDGITTMGGGQTSSAAQRLITLSGAHYSTPSYGTFAAGHRWHDLSLTSTEPLIAWGNQHIADEALIRGQLWDSVIITDSFAADTNITLDGRTYWAITNNNIGTAGASSPGTLFVAVT